jgi:hypothetical protein
MTPKESFGSQIRLMKINSLKILWKYFDLGKFHERSICFPNENIHFQKFSETSRKLS